MSVPNVTVITRTKDRTKLLKRALESIFAQSFQNFEVVIVNDGGKIDAINEIVKTYGGQSSKINVINNEKSVGVGAALNLGIKNSDSKYIAVLDDDDTWHKDFLKETIEYLEANDIYKGVITASELIIESVEGSRIEEASRQRLTPFIKDFNLFYVSGANQFTINSFVYSRDVYKKIGYFDEKVPVLEDWDFNVRFIESFDVAFIDKVLSYYHKRDNQTGPLSNTIYGTHVDYTKHLLNDSLRNDLKDGKAPMGLVANLSYANNVMLGHLYKQQASMDSLIQRADEEAQVINRISESMRLMEERLARIEANTKYTLPNATRKYVKKLRNRKSD